MKTRQTTSPFQRISLRARMVLSFTLLAFVAVGLTMTISYIEYRTRSRNDLKQRLLNIVALAALQQDGDQFLSVTSAAYPAYDQIRRQNTAIKDSDPDIRFVYTMRYDAEGVYFVVDAGQLTDPGFSPFGTRYQSPGPVLAANYSTMDHPMVEQTTYHDEYGDFLSAYAPFYTSDHRLAGIIAVDITANKILADERQALIWHIFVFLLSLPLVAIAGWFLGRTLTAPITALTQVANRIAEGELDFRPAIRTDSPEITTLGQALYSMADQLRGLISDLEKRVAERTRALERRAMQMQAAADVGATIARLRDPDELLKQVTRLIGRRFNFYHVAIFLLDGTRDYAILRAASSEGGMHMLEEDHRLRVGREGIVGYVTSRGEPRIALDVGQDAVFFRNPHLPLTRSEMAVPIIASGTILGALDIQSTEPAAFTDEDIKTVKMLADQIAVAIENARLFEENRATIDAARRAFGESSLEGWRTLFRERKTDFGYVSITEDQVAPVSGEIDPDLAEVIKDGQSTISPNGSTLFMPVSVRGKTIGAIRLERHQDGTQWTDEDVNVANILAEQLGSALESARLYAEISERAERESAISDITSKISASIQMDTILRTAVGELGQALGDAEIILQLGNDTEKKGGRRE